MTKYDIAWLLLTIPTIFLIKKIFEFAFPDKKPVAAQAPKLEKPNDTLLSVLEAALKRKDEWKVEKYYVIHKNSDVKIWIANGKDSLHSDASGMKQFRFTDDRREKLWPVIRELIEYHNMVPPIETEMDVIRALMPEETACHTKDTGTKLSICAKPGQEHTG